MEPGIVISLFVFSYIALHTDAVARYRVPSLPVDSQRHYEQPPRSAVRPRYPHRPSYPPRSSAPQRPIPRRKVANPPCGQAYSAYLGYCRANTLLNEVTTQDPVTLATYLFDPKIETVVRHACSQYYEYNACEAAYSRGPCSDKLPKADRVVHTLFGYMCNSTIIHQIMDAKACLATVPQDPLWAPCVDTVFDQVFYWVKGQLVTTLLGYMDPVWASCVDTVFDQVFYWIKGQVWVDDAKACLLPYMLTDCVANLNLVPRGLCSRGTGVILSEYIRRVRDAVFNFPCGSTM